MSVGPEKHTITVIELLVVVIVIGIVAAFAVSATGFRAADQSAAGACMNSWRSVAASAEAIKARQGGYPEASDLMRPAGLGGALDTLPRPGGVYRIVYQPIGTESTVTVDGVAHTLHSSFLITVKDRSGSTVRSNDVDVTTAHACDLL